MENGPGTSFSTSQVVMAWAGECTSFSGASGRSSTDFFKSPMISSARAGAVVSTTTQPPSGSIHTRVSRKMLKALGSSSSVTRSFSSRICLRPGLKPCSSSSAWARARVNWLMTEAGSSFFSARSVSSQ